MRFYWLLVWSVLTLVAVVCMGMFLLISGVVIGLLVGVWFLLGFVGGLLSGGGFVVLCLQVEGLVMCIDFGWGGCVS